MKFLILLLLLSCTTTNEIKKPVDYSETIKEVSKSNELDSNPGLKEKIVRTIKESSDYANECYSKLNDKAKELNEALSNYDELKKENKKLLSELDNQFWSRTQKRYFIYFTILITVLGIGYILYKTNAIWLPIIKRLAGIPI